MPFIARFATLLALLLLLPTQSSPPPGGWFGGGNKDDNHNWSSMLTIDPSKLISTMIKHGGLLIPESSRKDLEVFAKVCHADEVRLNVAERKLEVKNFVVQLPGEEEALRIGRVYLHWDSYLKPCIEIEVNDVAILVEFHNVIFTSSNWNELKKNGFPPELPADTPSSKTKRYESFVRIGSIDLSGTVVALLKSKPLKKDLAEVKFALDTFDTLDEQIKTQSLENLASTGRRGCTTDELYTLIQNFMGGMLKQVLVDTFEDVAGGGTTTFDRVDNVVKLTKKSISTYINDAGEWSGEQVQGKLKEQLEKMGIPTDNPQSKQALSLLAKSLQKSSNTILSKNERLQQVYNNIFRDDEDTKE